MESNKGNWDSIAIYLLASSNICADNDNDACAKKQNVKKERGRRLILSNEFKMKKTSFNLIDFFNFQSVGEYNKDTQFHPIEQAMIIWKSHVVSIEKKCRH